MIPTALTIPATLPPGVFGALFEPTGLLGLVSAAVAALSVGLALAVAIRPAATSPRRVEGRNHAAVERLAACA